MKAINVGPVSYTHLVAVVADGIDADIVLTVSGKGILTHHLDELKLHKIAVHQAIK